MTSLHDILGPPPAPALIYNSERITCHNFTSTRPHLVHHAALLQVIEPAKAADPCSTCGEAIAPPGQPSAAFATSRCALPA